MIKDYYEKDCVFVRGRSKKPLVILPKEWDDVVDLDSLTVHLTPIGADQKLIVKRVQGREVHLQAHAIPIDCYYLVIGRLLDKDG